MIAIGDYSAVFLDGKSTSVGQDRALASAKIATCRPFSRRCRGQQQLVGRHLPQNIALPGIGLAVQDDAGCLNQVHRIDRKASRSTVPPKQMADRGNFRHCRAFAAQFTRHERTHQPRISQRGREASSGKRPSASTASARCAATTHTTSRARSSGTITPLRQQSGVRPRQ